MAKILMIDDDEDLLKVTSKILETKGFEVATAQSIRHGRTILDADKIDLILLDIGFKDDPLEGIQAFEQFRSDEKLADIPVIFCSGRPEDKVAFSADPGEYAEKIEKYSRAPVDYIEKPFKNDVLVEKVTKLTANVG